MPVKSIKGNKVEEEIQKGDYPVYVVMFSAPKWCSPCQQSHRMLADLDKQNKLQDVMVYEVDIDDDDSINYSSVRGVRGVPTFLKMDQNLNVLKSSVGAPSPSTFLEFIKV